MADSFSKKENSKKKSKKQQDKASRREERKTNNNKGKSLDDMIVYIDINGNFTSVPPHLQNREEDLAKAKRPDRNTSEETDKTFTGIVTFFSEKGFGFITEESSGDSIFFHQGELNIELKKHDKVNYKKEHTQKGYKAVEIIKQQK